MIKKLSKYKKTNIVVLILLLILLALTLYNNFGPKPPQPKEVSLNSVMAQINADNASSKIKKLKLTEGNRTAYITYKKKGKVKEKASYPQNYGETIYNKAVKQKIPVKINNDPVIPTKSWVTTILSLAPGFLIIGLVAFMLLGSGFSLTGSKPISEIPKTRFRDIAGAKEALEDITEIVDFLKDSERFKEVGARAPSGALLVGPPGTGKQLHKDTPIPTWNNGFSTVAALKAGDVIIDESGKPTTILGKHQPMESDLFEIEFNDGIIVKCGGSHLWEVQSKEQRTKAHDESMVLSTRKMVEFYKTNEAKLSVKNSAPIQYEEKNQPFDTHTFGLWLGEDGTKDRIRIGNFLEDIELYSSELPLETHIPAIYLNGSIAQRVELLHGLMDAGGRVGGLGGCCSIEFTTKAQELIKDTYKLITSLGIKVYKKTHLLDGKELSVSMSFYPGMQVFKSPGKAEKLTPFIEGQVANEKLNRRYINDIRPINDAPEDYYCFTVDSPNNLFLCTDGHLPTHNTLLAKAVAGESNVPFFETTGASFIEMFVGLGARRVKSLFKEARKHPAAIIFIDEIDAVGGKRTQTGGGDDREHSRTVNALLAEMDGFHEGNVIVLAATNDAESLDSALTRSGRFDRKIIVDLPDWQGRLGILEIHTQGKSLAADVDLEVLARTTVGLSGADLATLTNEALIIAVRGSRTTATHEDFMEALSVVTLGRARKSIVFTEQDKSVVAWHESGHAVVGMAVDEINDPTHVTIVPRGVSGGHTKLQEDEDRFQTSQGLRGHLAMTMGGMAAELLMLGDITQGPGHDLEAATSLANKMVSKMGMGGSLGVIADQSIMVNSAVSEGVREKTEELITEALNRAKDILSDPKWRKVFDAMAAHLLEFDTIEYDAIIALKALALEE